MSGLGPAGDCSGGKDGRRVVEEGRKRGGGRRKEEKQEGRILLASVQRSFPVSDMHPATCVMLFLAGGLGEGAV